MACYYSPRSERKHDVEGNKTLPACCRAECHHSREIAVWLGSVILKEHYYFSLNCIGIIQICESWNISDITLTEKEKVWGNLYHPLYLFLLIVSMIQPQQYSFSNVHWMCWIEGAEDISWMHVVSRRPSECFSCSFLVLERRMRNTGREKINTIRRPGLQVASEYLHCKSDTLQIQILLETPLFRRSLLKWGANRGWPV